MRLSHALRLAADACVHDDDESKEREYTTARQPVSSTAQALRPGGGKEVDFSINSLIERCARYLI